MFARLVALASLAIGLAQASTPLPTVHLDHATVIGLTNNSVTSFTGIPFAKPPVGNLRFRLPVPVAGYSGTINATRPAAQCVQLAQDLRADMPAEIQTDIAKYLATILMPADVPQSEDCLTVDVTVPEGTKAGDKLPVLVSIYGGKAVLCAWVQGSTAQYPMDTVVRRSAELGEPVVVVAMNYRLHAFGFLGGKEVKNSGVANLGLQDQRLALRWIQKHISAFGGDPTKVTIWGESAGGMSVGYQMLANDGDAEGLFRAAVAQSGSPLPTGDVADLQRAYDAIVSRVGCAREADTLQCLRGVPVQAIVAAAGTLGGQFSYQGTAGVINWTPHADGVFLTDLPQRLILKGAVARVPLLSGDVLDEGTLFATSSFNATTDADFAAFVHDFSFPGAPAGATAPLLALYPDDPARGSPFGTGAADALAPQYKRIAAYQGDLVWQGPRRFFLDAVSGTQPVWSYRFERETFTGLGTPHGSDYYELLREANDMADYLVHFTHALDPNGAPSNRTIGWPRYDPVRRQVLRQLAGDVPLDVADDFARLGATEALMNLTLAYPL
ncbi:alpha/beta-hydrolase [Epithele typhae]|uniref:alpha/beta-hydrolase n=1 Tax=Epithele typhae TaxID=378194 RepID=UPI0020085081|nr:alpha/beta-hydrolase [Epithele typhae]KAH9926321.1 alpha/beta-hydrolase [Epithele typhae]